MRAWLKEHWLEIMVSLAVLLFAGSLGVSVRTSAEVHRVQVYECHQIDVIKHNIVTQYERSLVTLPTLTYYKHHPDEMEGQLKLIKEQIRFYKTPACPTT